MHIRRIYVKRDESYSTGFTGDVNVGDSMRIGLLVYDNVIVTLPEEDAPVQDVSKQQVWFTDTFEAETTMAERGWDIDGTIQTGELVLTHKNATAFLTQIPGSANWADYTAQANVTAVVEGNRIRCFVDGQLVFDVTDNANSNPTGYVGLRTVGYSGAYDNIIVRKITDADRKGVISGTATSPTTGDYAMSMYIPIVLMVSALATTIFVIRRRYNTNK